MAAIVVVAEVPVVLIVIVVVRHLDNSHTKSNNSNIYILYFILAF